MVLNFSTGEYGQAVYSSTSSQVAGQNGAIATTNPAVMQGGKRRSRRNKTNRKNKNRKNKSRRQRQRGGK